MYAADLHIHSKYSRATSSDCVPAMLELWSRRKGISLLGAGDFTHPAWRQMLTEQLTPAQEGLYRLKKEFTASDPFAPPDAPDVRFLISGEISSIYKQGGRVRKVHSVILLPSLEAAESLSRRLEAIGNIRSDGRPILGLSAHDLLDLTLTVCPEAMFIPAHIWTPHFSLFGAFSGFDTIEECFSDLTGHIHALETGLSSDPEMNRRVSALDKYTLVSNSDAHSPAKLGRELNLIGGEMNYPALKRALEGGKEGGFIGTVEFFPEEGKYHFDGHRACSVCLSPEEARAQGDLCPVCGKRMTPGVYHRVMQLADRPEGYPIPDSMPSFERLIPLCEVIASVSGVSAASARAQSRCEAMIHALGSELRILRDLPADVIRETAGAAIAEGISRMRRGEVILSPGYDGEYGKISLMTADEARALSGQMTFLDALLPEKPRKKKTAAGETAAPAPEIPAAAQAPSAASGLNERQKEAAESDARATAVIAGPGSGKTKTLIARIAHLISQGVKPEKIAAVTFTNRAAGELKDRLVRHFGSGKAVQGLTCGTFHSICLTLLKRTQPQLTVMDDAAALSLAGDIVNGLALKMTPAQLLREIEKGRAGDKCGVEEEILSLWEERLRALNAVRFDDLLRLELSDPLAPPFEHLCVDEYQDVNALQRELVGRWDETGASLFVIGDPDQSIYGFRGADASCFDRLLSARPHTRLVTLTMNYRSAPEILKSALPFISRDGRVREMVSGREPGGVVRRIPVADEYSEGIILAKEIAGMVGGMDMLTSRTDGGREIGFADIAVLYRTHRQAAALEKCLAAEGIPYTVSGREEYLNAPAVLGAVSWLKLLLHPDDRAALGQFVPGVRKDIPEDTDHESLCAYLEEADHEALAGLIRVHAEKAAREKPLRLLTQYQKEMKIGADEAFTKLLHTSSSYARLQDFLSDVVLGTEADLTRSGGKTYDPQSVHLMTLHASKGLEFPVVFLAGVRKGVLPLEVPYESPVDLSEERRLMYVGMTRAKDELILLTGPEASPFMRDIPEKTVAVSEPLYRPRPAGVQLSFFGEIG